MPLLQDRQLLSQTHSRGSDLFLSLHLRHLAAATGVLLLQDEDDHDHRDGDDDHDDGDRDGGVLAPGLLLTEAVALLLVPPVGALLHALELSAVLIVSPLLAGLHALFSIRGKERTIWTDSFFETRLIAIFEHNCPRARIARLLNAVSVHHHLVFFARVDTACAA